jgi:lysozyme family protein
VADFLSCYESMITDEGGYKLHTVAGDAGGMTYAGIARNMNPQWPGWAHIDRGDIPPSQMVRDFYRAGWWVPIKGDEIVDQGAASSIFNFAVNTSAYGKPQTAIKLAQIAVGVTPDGDFGPKTLAAINALDGELFELRYFLAKVTRYAEICNRNRSQSKFLLGWVNRSVKEAAR